MTTKTGVPARSRFSDSVNDSRQYARPSGACQSLRIYAKTMKILQVVRQYLPGTGGMETYVANLCRQLRDRGHQTDVATLDRLFKSGEPLPAYEEIDGTRVIRLPFSGTARYFVAPRLLQLLPRYDLVHVHGVDFFAELLGSLRKMHNVPVVLSTHGGFFHTPWLLPLKKAWFQTVTRLSLRGIDRVIASSPQDRELFKRICDDVSLVENGIDFATFSAVNKEGDGETLLFIGRLSKNKRVDRLIRATVALRRERPRAKLVIVGPDWEGLQDELVQLAAGLGQGEAVNFTGTLPEPEMLKRLAEARLFVSASEYEAFGLSAVEAMASGTVPVLNRITAFNDMIRDGENGFLTDFADPETAAKVLEAALGLPEEELREIGGRARQTAARHDWRKVAGYIEAVYEEAAGR